MPNNKMERFTQRARRVLSLAQEEAERLHHNYIGTEHMLVGLLREEEGIAGQVLRDLGLETRRLQVLVEELTRATVLETTTPAELSPTVKRVLELSVDEARRLGHHYIGTEHLLLGLVRQSDGVAIDALKRLGVSPEEVRRQTQRVLQESAAQNVTPIKPEANLKIPSDKAQSLHFQVIEKFILKLLGMIEAQTITFDQAKELLQALHPQIELLSGEGALAAGKLNQLNAAESRKLKLEIKAKESDVPPWVLELPVAAALMIIDELLVAAANYRAFDTTFEGSQFEMKLRIENSD